MPEPRTITEAAELIRRGELTPVDLLDQCLARVDRYEPKVRAWVVLDREGAREQAERLTTELKAGQNRGPLHGIPIGVKDIIDVFDLPTGCGSKLWANSYARRDATCVARLRQAGAIIMGKTVTTAFAYMDPPVTRNPWNLDRTPGGSSSGSAAAVACGMCLGALGTQTGGSVTRPASFCGVCSLKPTHGRISVAGALPFAPSLDHVGVMANCVRDLAILYQALDRQDDRNNPRPADYVHGTLIGCQSSQMRLAEFADYPVIPTPQMSTALTIFREMTKDANWGFVTVPLPPLFGEVSQNHYTVMAVEAAAVHLNRMLRHPDDYPPKIRGLIEYGASVPATDFMTIRGHLDEFRHLSDCLTECPWELIMTPATLGTAPGPDTTGDPVLNAPWSYAGLPTVSIPISWSNNGLPLAIQLIGHRRCEFDLLRTAATLTASNTLPRRPLPL